MNPNYQEQTLNATQMSKALMILFFANIGLNLQIGIIAHGRISDVAQTTFQKRRIRNEQPKRYDNLVYPIHFLILLICWVISFNR